MTYSNKSNSKFPFKDLGKKFPWQHPTQLQAIYMPLTRPSLNNHLKSYKLLFLRNGFSKLKKFRFIASSISGIHLG